MEGGCCRTRRIPKPCRTVTRPVAAAYGTARGLGVADLLDEMDCREDPQLADQEYDGLDSPLVPRDRHRIPLGRRHIHPLGQLAPQNAILGLQVVDHLGQFGLGRPGQNHEQGVENPGHAAITQVLGGVEHDNVFEHRRGGPEFLATRNRPKCPGGRGPITARIEMDAGGASLQPSRVAHSHRHLATWPPQVAGLALSPAVNPIATSSSALAKRSQG